MGLNVKSRVGELAFQQGADEAEKVILAGFGREVVLFRVHGETTYFGHVFLACCVFVEAVGDSGEILEGVAGFEGAAAGFDAAELGAGRGS